MGDGLFDLEPTSVAAPAPTGPMTQSQREAIRALFAELGVTDARRQFAVVEELIGRKINSVSELDESSAQTLLRLLPGKVATSARPSSGNAWDDRDEPTWIDQL